MKFRNFLGTVLRSLVAAGIGIGIGLLVRPRLQAQGSGAKGAPEVDGRLAAVDAIAVSSTGSRSSGMQSISLPGLANNQTPPPPQQSGPYAIEALYVRGYVVKGKYINVQLSDGRVFTERDPELTRVERNSVTIEGKKLFLRAPVSIDSRRSPEIAHQDKPTLTIPPVQ